MEYARKMMVKPVVDAERFDRVFRNHVYSLKGAYAMHPGEAPSKVPEPQIVPMGEGY
jgi:hypothetical protein